MAVLYLSGVYKVYTYDHARYITVSLSMYDELTNGGTTQFRGSSFPLPFIRTSYSVLFIYLSLSFPKKLMSHRETKLMTMSIQKFQSNRRVTVGTKNIIKNKITKECTERTTRQQESARCLILSGRLMKKRKWKYLRYLDLLYQTSIVYLRVLVKLST